MEEMLVSPGVIHDLIVVMCFPGGYASVPDGMLALLAEMQLIRSSPSRGYEITERGQKWVNMLIETPLPELKWIDPRTNK
jgi:hypothetical protein